jgi:2'-5' RNA ligase
VAELSTVGVLLPLPRPHQEHVDRYRTSLAGRAPQTPAHITLVPPTDVATRSLPAVMQHLSAVARARAPFDVVVRGTGSFRPVSPVVYLDVVAGADECGQLAARAGSGPLRTPARFPYHPHVTVAHHLCDPELDAAMADWAHFEAAWRVTAFTLYEYAASEWSALRSYPLGR